MNAADFAAVLGVWALAICAPGPDVVLVLREGVRIGRSGALAAAAGIVSGIVVWLALAMTGAHLLLEADHRILGGLQLLGGGYLLFLGGGAILAARATWWEGSGESDPPTGFASSSEGGQAETLGATAVGRPAASFRRGALTNLSNPKALVFFGTVFSVLVPAGTTTGERVVLSCVLVTVATVWFGALAWFASSVRIGGFLGRHAALFDAIAGGAFLLLGALAGATGFETLFG